MISRRRLIVGAGALASSIDGIRRAGIEQIDITARAVADTTPFWKGLLLGGVLAAETDRMFMERRKG